MTVLVPTFNHARYVAGAIGSVIRQTAFDEARVIVSDDCSSDDTFERAVRAAAGHPNILVRRNATNLGVMQHYRQLMDLVDTEFTAILEGDDEWIDRGKLAAQLRTLRRRTSMNLCFTACLVKDEASGESWSQPPWNDGRDRIVGLADLIRSNDISTFSNCAYRSRALRSALAEERALLGYDWLCNLIVGSAGEIGFLARPGTEYRLHPGGAWSRLSAEARAQRIALTLRNFREVAPPGFVPVIDDVLGAAGSQESQARR
jgi:glycosyltransferase involved in cell wall biosynthesis